MDAEEAETIAWRASSESGLDDRPNADPAVLAVGYLGMSLLPMVGARPRVQDRLIVYPREADACTAAYLLAHECGHVLLRCDGWRLPPEEEERAASRIGCALLLPRAAFTRDVHAEGCRVTLRRLWPLATETIIDRRLRELGLSVPTYAGRRETPPASARRR